MGVSSHWLGAGCIGEVYVIWLATHTPLRRLLSSSFLHAHAEVGYCQGMAFAAGILLMYLPEEPAFGLYCRLMAACEEGGCGLRRLYLPGLGPLKAELARFELLLAAHHPALAAHLAEAGLPAVLYASQWVMTVFAAPFPCAFAARVLDTLLLVSAAAEGGAAPSIRCPQGCGAVCGHGRRLHARTT